MPTTHVLPESDQLLQDIADCLGKAKKILVVTGAGISTNSGIPDFRSKNGLYSLIQAKFEAAACANSNEVEPDPNTDVASTTLAGYSLGPPSKRQKIRQEKEEEANEEKPRGVRLRSSNRRKAGLSNSKAEGGSTIHVAVPTPQLSDEETIYCAPSTSNGDHSIVVRLPNRISRPAETPSTPMCTYQAETIVKKSIECIEQPLCKFESGSLHPPSSSPLSSPPPILFDPEEKNFGSGLTASANSNQSSATSSTSSDSDSETDETACSSLPSLSTQSSFSSRSGLPNMKGRELFDVSIWADPMKTSVFYTFATTLRQKIKSVTPTPSHQFISNLRDTGKLVRCYTQNIDEIEEKVGLTTSLVLGPGKKGRFSSRSVSRASTGSGASTPLEQEAQSQSQEQAMGQGQGQGQDQGQGQGEASQVPGRAPISQDPCGRGVECVFLHGSLRMLRCFRCGHTTPWDENGRENETLSGRQPSCPRCEGATAAREGRGKRALAVGKLRPDIVLYGEEHPNAHLISPIVQHDISLAPDIMLILGTSLKVHGLKILIREFSKAVHSKGGKVVFVNFTKPPESVWSDVIDYWIQWDCDAWVNDLKERKPALWLSPGSVIEEPKKKRKNSSASGLPKGNQRNKKEQPNKGPNGKDNEPPKEPPKEEEKKEKKAANRDAEKGGSKKAGRQPNPDARRPLAVRDDTANGAFVVWKIMNEFARIAGRPGSDLPKVTQALASSGRRKPRHSAPAGPIEGKLRIILESRTDNDLNKPGRVGQPQEKEDQEGSHRVISLSAEASSASLPNAIIAEFHSPPPAKATSIQTPASNSVELKKDADYSILSAVKANPRRRQSKKLLEAQETETLRRTGTRTRASNPGQQKKETKKRAKSMGALPLAATFETVQQQQQVAWMETDKLTEKLFAQLSKPTSPAAASHTAPSSLSAVQDKSLAQPTSSTAVPPPIQRQPSPLLPKPDLDNAFFFQDPLCNSYGFPPRWPQVWSCNEQVRREADEQVGGG